MLHKMTSCVELSSQQFGYRENTSTSLAICLLKEVTHKYCSENSKVFACFLDMSKAFERVNHKILLEKMTSLNIPAQIVDLYRAIFKNSHVRVKFQNALSDDWQAIRGVRQGGVTSAFLFSIYIDEILTNISAQPDGCWLGLKRINIQAYADDLVVFCPTVIGLKNLLKLIEENLKRLELKINVEKTKIIIFSKRKYPENTLFFKINDKGIEIVDEYLYLGSIISGNMSEKSSIDRILSKFNKKVGMFFRKFSSIALHIKIELFDSLCMSLYGLDTIYDVKNCSASLRKLGVSYHYALKRLLGFPKHESNHYTCALLEKMTFQHFMKFQKTKFLFWMQSSSSPCLVGLKNYMIKFSAYANGITKSWSNLYDVRGVLDNDLCALRSRIFYVQNREDSSYINHAG